MLHLTAAAVLDLRCAHCHLCIRLRRYPDFKRAVTSTIHELGGRAASNRQSATVYVGKSKWSLIAQLLQDPEHMAKLGCSVIPASVSCLKKHRRRSDRSLQPKISDAAGQLDVSSRKVIKLLLPTEEEQPNGHQLNKGVKELEQFGMLNADLVDENNRDDKANWQLDNLYRKNQMLQETFQANLGKRLRFREENGAFDAQAYDRAMKAETHDTHGSTEGPDEPEQDDRQGGKRSDEVARGGAAGWVLQQTFPRHPARCPTARHGARGLHRKAEHRRGQ
jgi:hypothetical protein